MIIATYSKLTVAQDYELRKTLRSSGAKYRVVKNTLVKLASKGTKAEGALKDLAGVTSMAYTKGDPVALAKVMSKYAKDNPEFTFKAGVVEGRVVSIKEIESLATMPSKEEIYSKLLFMMNAPAQRLVTAMGAVGGSGGGCEPGRGKEQVQGSVGDLELSNREIWQFEKLSGLNFEIAELQITKLLMGLVISAEGCTVRLRLSGVAIWIERTGNLADR